MPRADSAPRIVSTWPALSLLAFGTAVAVADTATGVARTSTAPTASASCLSSSADVPRSTVETVTTPVAPVVPWATGTHAVVPRTRVSSVTFLPERAVPLVPTSCACTMLTCAYATVATA